MVRVATLLVLAMVSPVAAERDDFAMVSPVAAERGDEKRARNRARALAPDLEVPARALLTEPTSALEHDANVTGNADGHLVMGQMCDSTELKAGSAWAGAGGNSFVIRLTKTGVCGGKKGEILKGFGTLSYRDYGSGLLAALPVTLASLGPLNPCGDVLAGLACTANEVNKCHVESKCVNSNGFYTESQDCFYVRMKSGGSKTLEQCFADLNRDSKSVKFLMVKAVKALQCIHSANFFHRDFQLKNLMVDASCNSAYLKVVDLDGMEKQANKPSDAPFEAFQDYVQLFGACPSTVEGYVKLEDKVKNTKAKEMAKALRGAAEAALNCSSDPRTRKWSDMTNVQSGPAAKILAATKNL